MLARLGQMLDTEKARWVRYGCDQELECDASKIKVLDVSIGGLRILCPHQFEIDDVVTLSFPELPEDKARNIKCRVVWAGPADNEKSVAGLAFVASPGEVRAWVYNLIFDDTSPVQGS